jgi:hypothetical protein
MRLMNTKHLKHYTLALLVIQIVQSDGYDFLLLGCFGINNNYYIF